MKDLFSSHAKSYSAYRPTYPPELFEYILQFVSERKYVWDCATGNGQAAVTLAGYFDHVDATDISEQQINNAVPAKNIHYHVCPAEHTPFSDNRFDLITIAQAYHWISWKKFYDEATRTAKNGGVVAAWTYSLFSTDDPALNHLIDRFYYEIVAPYWDAERKYVDEGYASVEFDFKPLPVKNFYIKVKWSREQFTGYLNSWSAVQHYIKKNHKSPMEQILPELETLWPSNESKHFRFPVFLRLGRIEK
jgi:ubiquinone/menaquinone biosynthesis C-methylase UbiE